MHIADGVLSLPVVAGAAVGAIGTLVYSTMGTRGEEIPKISLLTGAFFVFSLISIPIGPTTVHPLLGGLLGIILGRRAPLAIFLGLLLQALLFQHGGLTTLGVNTLLVGLPALLAAKIFYGLESRSAFTRGCLSGGIAVIGCVILLVTVLMLSDPIYGEGLFSVINLLLIGYIPLAIVEAAMTGFAVQLLFKARPELFQRSNSRAVA